MLQFIAKFSCVSTLAIGLFQANMLQAQGNELSVENQLEQAIVWEHRGRVQLALVTYQSILQTSLPDSWRDEVLFRQARLQYQLGQFRQTRANLESYLQEFSTGKHPAEALALLAWTHLELSDTPKAVRTFQILHSKFPQSAQALEAAYWLACHAAEDSNRVTALEHVDWLLCRITEEHELEQQRAKLLHSRAICLKCQLVAEEEKWELIKSLVDNYGKRRHQAIENACLLFWRAEAEFRTRDFDQARKQFEGLQTEILGIDEPWVAMVPLRRAQLAARRQQWSKVLKILEDLEQAYPGFALLHEAQYLRGRAMAGRGEMTGARNAYRRVLEMESSQGTETAVRTEWMIGETFFHQKDYGRARASYLKVMQRNDFPEWQARAALQAGKCWELQQSWEQATSIYHTALERWQDSTSASMLEARLQWAEKQLTR